MCFNVNGCHGTLDGVGGGKFLTGAEEDGGGDVFVSGGADVFVETFGCGGGDCVAEGEVGAAGLAADQGEGEYQQI